MIFVRRNTPYAFRSPLGTKTGVGFISQHKWEIRTSGGVNKLEEICDNNIVG